MLKAVSSKSPNALLVSLLFGLISFIFLYSAYTSAGYDDEFYNIRLVREMSLLKMIQLLQSEDLHPPLSYILNYILFHLTDSWNLVRVCSALFFLAALGYWTKQLPSNKAKIWGLILLGLNPTILMWVVGIRWYAYMVPLVLILSVLPSCNKWYYWPKFFLILMLIWFLGYIGFFLAIPYFFYYWLNDTSSWKKKLTIVIPLGILFALAYAYQAYIFLTVHSQMDLKQTNNQQVFDLKSSLSYYFSSVFSNQGVFPISLGGLFSITGSLLLYGSLLLIFKDLRKKYDWMIFALLSILFLASGIAGKVRNLVLLEPSRNRMFLELINSKKKITWLGFLLVIIGNGIGLYNILNHSGTTKNALNIPVEKTMNFLENLEQKGANEIYFTHHPTFDYHLITKQKKVVSFYNSLYFDSVYFKTTNIASLQNQLPAQPHNFTFILNYKGRSITQEHFDEMLGAMKQIKADTIKRFYLDKDPEYAIRRKLFPDYPEYTTVVIKYFGVKGNIADLSVWEKNN